MKTLPESLSRRGIAAEFDKLTPVAWEKLFEREDINGLVKLRVPGDMRDRVYYSVEGVALWLVRNDYYTRQEINEQLGLVTSSPAIVVRQVRFGT
jgi:hypothetical protein